MNSIKKIIFLIAFAATANTANAQLFFTRTSDTTWKFTGEFGLLTGSYTYDQFAPDFYLEGFQFQLKKGIYYRKENVNSAFRLSVIFSNGTIHHIAKQYYEIKDTINLDGRWKNSSIQIGFEKNLYHQNNFVFYTGLDAEYRKHKFTGSGKSMFDEMNFQQNINSYGMGAELFLGTRFIITRKIKLSIETAFSALIINERSNRNYLMSTVPSTVNTSKRFSIEPSPFNRISIGYQF